MGKVLVGVIVGLIVVVLLIVGAFLWGQALVDVFLILVALVSLAAFALLGYAAFQIIGLVKEVRGELSTLVGTAQETMAEVRGTAQFVSDNVVHPVSQAVGFVTAARATAKSLTEPLAQRFRS